jgi:hypothetical protein
VPIMTEFKFNILNASFLQTISEGLSRSPEPDLVTINPPCNIGSH